jgi:hypothetical protein
MRVSARLNVNAALIAVSADVNAPPSPATLQYRRDHRKYVQLQAMRDLRLLRQTNGGKLPRGAIMALVKKYRNRGTDFVTVYNLRYRLKQEKIGKKTLDDLCEDDKPVKRLKKSAICTVDSPLTDDDDEVVLGGRSPTVDEALIAESSDKDNFVVEDIVEGDDDDDLEDEEQGKTSSEGNSKKSGRPIGSTNQ